jgi:hypothetical protein
VCFKSLPPNISFLDGPLNASSRTSRNRRRDKRRSQNAKKRNTSEETNDVQIGITYEGITNDIQVGEAEANGEEGRDDNKNEWTDDHFYGNIDVSGLLPATTKRKETSADVAERKKRVEGKGCNQNCISSMM